VTRDRPELLEALTGGDLRSIGNANRVVGEILAAPERFADIVAGLDDSDPVVRLRAADVAEKVSRARPHLLAPHKAGLLMRMETARDKEARWHLAQMAPRLPLAADERERVVGRLLAWLDDESRIVQASALAALADLSDGDPRLRQRVVGLAEALASSGAPAVRARARKTLARLRGRASP
jgi:hypothetical protein